MQGYIQSTNLDSIIWREAGICQCWLTRNTEKERQKKTPSWPLVVFTSPLFAIPAITQIVHCTVWCCLLCFTLLSHNPCCEPLSKRLTLLKQTAEHYYQSFNYFFKIIILERDKRVIDFLGLIKLMMDTNVNTYSIISLSKNVKNRLCNRCISIAFVEVCV